MQPIDLMQQPLQPIHQLIALLDQLGEVVLVADRAGKVSHLSSAARRLVGIEANEVPDACLGDWMTELAGLDQAQVERLQDEFCLIPGGRQGDAVVTLFVGSGKAMEASAAVCKTALNGQALYVWLLRDHSRLRHTELQMMDAQRLVRSILQNTSEGYVLVDASGLVIDSNPAFEAMCGMNPMDLRESRIGTLFDGKSHKALQAMISKLERGRTASAEVRFNNVAGNETVGLFKGAPLFDANDEQVGIFGLITDITDTKAKEQKIEKLAFYDPLTDLANRSLLQDKLEQAILFSQRSKSKFALLFLDLDRFKHVNDTLNHPIGDQLLKQVGERVRGVVRRSDVVARFGGDEFVIGLVEPKRIEDAALVAEKLLRVVAEPFEIDTHTLHITTSIGISVFPDDASSVDDLIRSADLAMYQAKEEGRERYCYFTEALNERVRHQREVERQMRNAIQNKEFVLHYQPKIDSRSGRVVGAEALIRWHSPALGFVSPGEFIPLAEETGMIIPIGEWVLREVCDQLLRWQEQGLPMVPVAVNVSGNQLHHNGFKPFVEALIKQSGQLSQWLELEITESTLMRDVEMAIALLQELCDLGFVLSIDDFGTGYSSFSYLTRFPIHTLKIDQSFVRDLPQHESAVTIVGAIAGMAKSLGLKIVAEGVETRAQSDHLINLGCDQLQGYYYSRPVPVEKFECMLRDGLTLPGEE